MAEDTEKPEAPSKKPSKLPLVLGLVLATLLGGGGFFAVYSGMILGGDSPNGGDHSDETAQSDEVAALPDVVFVPMEPLVINLGSGGSNRYLRFRAHLEVDPKYESDVTTLLPRVIDVLNSYLRAVDITDLADPAALMRLRAQMLRRVKIVTGEGRVRDLLIMEFVLN